jgi:hypothetical protein
MGCVRRHPCGSLHCVLPPGVSQLFILPLYRAPFRESDWKCSCLSARRRRRVGATPYYGTGWVGRAPFGYGQAQYGQQQPPYGNQNQYQQQPYNSNQAPPYSPPQEQDFYGGQNQGYYGGQQTGVELQQPQNTFQNQRGGDSVYEPPAGPPPTKGDGIVR